MEPFKISRWLKNYYEDLNFEKLTDRLNTVRKSNLHPETRAVLDLLEANILLDINKEKANELFNNIAKPTYTYYKHLYNMVNMGILVNQKAYDAFDENYTTALGELLSRNSYHHFQKSFQRIKMVKEMWQNGFADPKIETEFALKGKYLYNDLNNASVLVNYHLLKGNTEEAEKYRKFILEKGQKLPQLIKDMEIEYK